jgi:HD superfamily phosphohydrolase
MDVIEVHLRAKKTFLETKAHIALAASLVHDLGHGPFSHAFEEVGKRLGLLGVKMANHEKVSDRLIRESEVSGELNKLGSGYASDVANIIKSSSPGSLYDAVVSSQFDADRLDYMRRDRLMTGTHHGAIDFDWLISNLEVGTLPYGVDKEQVGTIETFVLGPKALYAAETYLLGLFQLYPTVYFHKATRGAEKLFSELLYRIISLVRDNSAGATGLPDNHPLIEFARKPEDLNSILNLDDTVVWGATSMLAEAKDSVIRNFACRLRDRKLFKCIDVVESLKCPTILENVVEWKRSQEKDGPRILVDQATREPYKHFQESKGPLNQIMIRTISKGLVDVAQLSNVVKGIETFTLFRLYAAPEDIEAQSFLKKVISSEGT